MVDRNNFPGGWQPRSPDVRDFRARPFLTATKARRAGTATDQLIACNKKIQRSWWHHGSDLAHWLNLATELITAAPPDPPPAPAPSPIPEPPVMKRWESPAILDQRDTGHCVGFAAAAFLLDEPVQDPGINDDTGHTLYYECKVIDGEPRAENGSNVRSAGEALLMRQRIAAYAFAESVADIRDWLLVNGPVQWGSVFLNGMFDLNASGFMVPSGGVAGGHSWMWVGYDSLYDVFTGQNSWGTPWGENGYFKMHGEDVESLWKQDAEAMMTLELPL